MDEQVPGPDEDVEELEADVDPGREVVRQVQEVGD